MSDVDTSDVSWNDDRKVYTARFGDGRSPCVAIVEALAAALPDDHDHEPLFEYVDPDALDVLVGDRPGSPTSSSVTVTFPVEGLLVTVGSDGRVSVRP